MAEDKDSKQSTILDIEHLVKEYAWAWLQSEKRNAGWLKCNRFRGFRKIEDVEFDVNVERLDVTSSKPFTKKLLERMVPTENETLSLVKTVFANNTQKSQEYNFKTERQTTSSFSLFRETGFSFGNTTKIGFKLPYKIGSISTGFDTKFSFTKGEEKTVEETLIWSTDSKIVVPPGSKTTAEFVVEEDKYDGSFTMMTTLQGYIGVKIIRNVGGHQVQVFPFSINVVDLFEHYAMNLQKNRKTQDAVNHVAKIIDHQKVELSTKGDYALRFGVKQHIRLNQEPGVVQDGD